MLSDPDNHLILYYFLFEYIVHQLEKIILSLLLPLNTFFIWNAQTSKNFILWQVIIIHPFCFLNFLKGLQYRDFRQKSNIPPQLLLEEKILLLVQIQFSFSYFPLFFRFFLMIFANSNYCI